MTMQLASLAQADRDGWLNQCQIVDPNRSFP
jgi:hypothetical protein